MACTGYDSKAVKLPKAVKRQVSTIVDAHERGAIIRSYVQLLIADAHQSKNRSKDKR